MSRETDLAVLLAQESLVLTAMMNIRYAVDDFQKPQQMDINTIREVGDRFVGLAVRIHEDDKKREAAREAEEYGSDD